MLKNWKYKIKACYKILIWIFFSIKSGKFKWNSRTVEAVGFTKQKYFESLKLNNT